MFGTLMRWMVRLFFFALIASAVGFVITRLMGGEDEDFDDFEDLESSFEFNETPVEIDVSGPATTDVASMVSDDTSNNNSDDNSDDSSEVFSSAATVALDEGLPEDSEDEALPISNGTGDGSRLIDIKGIGPSYESRLRAIGINTFSDLINADADQVVEQVGVIGGASTVEDWKEQARAMVNEG